MYRTKLILFFSLCILTVSGYSQSQYYVSTLAGDTADMYKGLDSNAGYRNGIGINARFNGPTAIATDTYGNVYVADTYNNVIRKINVSTDSVTTLAGDTTDIKKGLDSNLGYLNGPALSAKFSNPLGICVDKYGNVYIADTYNNVIRKLSTSGIVTTYAGRDSSGIPIAGYVNGPDSTAEFFLPIGLAIDTAGNIYVADNGNNAIREIATTGMVTTLAGHGPDSAGYENGQTSLAELTSLFGITLDKHGAIYVSQFSNGVNAIRRLYNGNVTTYVGYDTVGLDTNVLYPPPNYTYVPIPSGYQNGKDTVNRDDTAIIGILFNDPTGIAFDTAGNLLIADEGNNVIRKMNSSDSIVTTFAGDHSNTSDTTFMNGWDTLAYMYNPMGIATDKKGNVYVADLGNNVIRKINLQPYITGINPVKKPVYALNVYPNPCTDRLNIVSSINGKATLLDVTGRIIWTNDNFKSPYILSTSSISPGVYFLRISSPTASEIKKIEVVR